MTTTTMGSPGSSSSSSSAQRRRRRPLFLLALALALSSSNGVQAFVLPTSHPSLSAVQLQPVGAQAAAAVGALAARAQGGGAGQPDDESLYYGDGSGGGGRGGGGGGGRGQQQPARRPMRPPPPPQRRPAGGGGGGGRGGGGGVMGRGGGNVPQRDMAEIIERSGRDGPEWKRAVDLDNFGRRDNNPNQQGGGGRGGGRRNNFPRPPHQGGGGGGGRGRGGRPVQQKKSWWTSEFNRMDGELEVPLPWWAEKGGAKGAEAYGEMKVPDLKAELQRRGAKVSGTKQELIERLEELDKLYTLTDEGFREAIVVDDSHEALPGCFPETYGDEFEVSLLEASELSEVRNFAP